MSISFEIFSWILYCSSDAINMKFFTYKIYIDLLFPKKFSMCSDSNFLNFYDSTDKIFFSQIRTTQSTKWVKAFDSKSYCYQFPLKNITYLKKHNISATFEFNWSSIISLEIIQGNKVFLWSMEKVAGNKKDAETKEVKALNKK